MGKSSYELLAEIRSTIEEILAKMLFIKKEGKNRGELRELVTQASVMFLNLRQINRIILQDEDRSKAETEAAKTPVDYTTLQLHNLLYEKNHYLKAIKACKDFKSKYPDIELVPEEEFFRDAPDEFKADPLLKDDPHKRMLERLNFELYQRKELCKQRELLEARKRMLQESIANRKKFISSLPSHLKALKKASLPVQQHLGIMHTKRMKQHQLAELLPAPLYILYSQFLSQKEALDEGIDLEIIGSAKDAQAVARQQAMKDSGLDEIKVDDEIPEEEEDSQRRRKRAKKSHLKETADGGGIYQGHPLIVLLHVYDDDLYEGEKPIKLVTLRFEYLLKLKVVCAGTEGAEGGPLELLTNLFPDDTGLDLPNQIAKLLAGLEFQYDEKRLLRPYKWAQHLAGIDFLPEVPLFVSEGFAAGNDSSKGASISSGISTYRQQRRVQTILQKLRSRKKAHLALKDQLDILAKLKLPSLKFTKVPWGLHNAKCSLQSWAEVEPSSQKLCTIIPDGLLPAIPVADSLDGVEGSSRREAETAREDGELPSGAWIAPAASGTDYFEVTGGKGFSTKGAGRRNRHSLTMSRSPAVGLEIYGVKGEVGFNGSVDEGDVSTVLMGDVAMGTDFYVEYNIDHTEIAPVVEILNSTTQTKVAHIWEDCGIREFCAILRRESGLEGEAIELEAQVRISCEYPLRPPHFSMRFVSCGDAQVLPRAPNGVLDVVETFRSSATSGLSFNELRAMEAEVNIRILENLPQSEENDILAHQILLLSMLFDLHIDHEISISGERNGSIEAGGLLNASLAELVVGKMVLRIRRGRNRQMLVL